MSPFFILAIGILPSLLWLGVMSAIYHRERATLLAVPRVFLFGMLATIPTIALELLFGSILHVNDTSLRSGIWQNVIIAATVEELCKFAALALVVFRMKLFKRPLDGIIFGITVGLGFVAIENLLVVQFFGTESILFRTLTTTLLHAATTGLFGFYCAIAHDNPRARASLITQGAIIAILLHGIFNLVLFGNGELSRIILIIVLVVLALLLGIATMKLWRESEPTAL